MTAVDLDALDKLRGAATPGPWAQHPADDQYVIGDVSDDGMSYADVGDTYAFRKREGSYDAALIVAAVNALPDLIAEVRRGRTLREAVDGLAEEWNAMQTPVHSPPINAAGAASRLRAVVAAVDGGEQ